MKYVRPVIKASGDFHPGKYVCESPCPSGIGWVSDTGPTMQSAYLRWRIAYVARRQGTRGSLPPPPLCLVRDDIAELFENHAPVDAVRNAMPLVSAMVGMAKKSCGCEHNGCTVCDDAVWEA